MGYPMYCILFDFEVEIMKNFFKEINSGKILWEDAKSRTILNLNKLEFPRLSDKDISKLHQKSPKIFNSWIIFRELETNNFIKNIIRDIRINQILD